MQVNYHLLARLIPELNKALERATFVEAFSQEKDELIICFLKPGADDFYIRATLTSSFTCLSFPQDFKRSRKNSANQFSELEGRVLTGIRLFQNERAFALQFDSHSLVFKMHGNRSNILLFTDEALVSLFKNQLRGDLSLDIRKLDRPIERSLGQYLKTPDYRTFYPTFGKIPATYLEKRGFSGLTASEQWHMLQEVLTLMATGPCYLLDDKGKPVLSMLDLGKGKILEGSMMNVLNQFFRAYTGTYYFERDKKQLLDRLAKSIRQTESYIRKSETKLEQLTEEIQPQQIADILMANLYQIAPRQKKVRLLNFYNNQEIDIKLNPELSPQKNAENYYRKSKNRKIEIEKTESNVLNKYEQLEQLRDQQKQISILDNFKALRKYAKDHQLDKSANNQTMVILPYKQFECEGYQIWVGKNAKSNDELSLKYTFKDDLWLHAKDSPGSHVVVKHQAGKNIPKMVIERAAELAAWYSKRKTDSLVPVIVTPAKHVRKRKGSPAGQVIVSKEDVVMVEPKGPT